jgi:hypothetical protein
MGDRPLQCATDEDAAGGLPAARSVPACARSADSGQLANWPAAAASVRERALPQLPCSFRAGAAQQRNLCSCRPGAGNGYSAFIAGARARGPPLRAFCSAVWLGGQISELGSRIALPASHAIRRWLVTHLARSEAPRSLPKPDGFGRVRRAKPNPVDRSFLAGSMPGVFGRLSFGFPVPAALPSCGGGLAGSVEFCYFAQQICG